LDKIRNWLARRLPTRRRLIQLYAALLYNANLRGFVEGDIYTGGTKRDRMMSDTLGDYGEESRAERRRKRQAARRRKNIITVLICLLLAACICLYLLLSRMQKRGKEE